MKHLMHTRNLTPHQVAEYLGTITTPYVIIQFDNSDFSDLGDLYTVYQVSNKDLCSLSEYMLPYVQLCTEADVKYCLQEVCTDDYDTCNPFFQKIKHIREVAISLYNR